MPQRKCAINPSSQAGTQRRHADAAKPSLPPATPAARQCLFICRLIWVYNFCRAVTKSGQSSLLSGSPSLSERQKKDPAAREAAPHAAWAQLARWHPGFGQVPPVSTHTCLCSRVGMYMLVLPHSGKKLLPPAFSLKNTDFAQTKHLLQFCWVCSIILHFKKKKKR